MINALDIFSVHGRAGEIDARLQAILSNRVRLSNLFGVYRVWVESSRKLTHEQEARLVAAVRDASGGEIEVELEKRTTFTRPMRFDSVTFQVYPVMDVVPE